MAKEKALVICPGRGTYNASELGYFHKHHSNKKEFLASLDALRAETGQAAISALDAADAHKVSVHGTGDNASLLIYACALADFMDIDRDRFDIACVTGNSMGWYLALAAAGALSLSDGAMLVNTMGTLMHEEADGGQVVYPIVDENWNADPAKIATVNTVIEGAKAKSDCDVHISIRLGGMIVLAANKAGLSYLKSTLPAQEHFPMLLRHHAAFHSPILDPIVGRAQSMLSADMFGGPSIPMVDGEGRVWNNASTDVDALYDYTLGAQINRTYDFSKAVEVASKEFAPDRIIILGPGTTMGGATAQSLIPHAWRGMTDKASFLSLQKSDPYIIAMGMDDQRALVV